MEQQYTKIKCPQCGHLFPVDEALSKQAEERIRLEYEERAARQAENIKKQKEELEVEKERIENLKEEQEQVIKERLETERLKLKSETEAQVRDEFGDRLQSLQEENEKRRKENKELKQHELELLKKENALKEKEEELQLEIEKEMLAKRDEIAEDVRKNEQERNELKFREYKKQLEDQKKLIEEMKRKSEQGSMKMQGEVQELALEELLKTQFSYDIIEDVPTGVQGADVIQTVVNEIQQVCGKIIYESKRTKSFSDKWIEKLKNDQRRQQAELAVIVTEVMPKGMDRFGGKDGVWICNYQEVKGLSLVLREMLIKTHSVKSAEVNKTDKMEMLYNYLTGEDFSRRVSAIVEGFSTLKTDIDKEKRAMQKIWKEREKQIEKVITNTIDMYGSIKGIAGKAVGTVKALELPEP